MSSLPSALHPPLFLCSPPSFIILLASLPLLLMEMEILPMLKSEREVRSSRRMPHFPGDERICEDRVRQSRRMPQEGSGLSYLSLLLRAPGCEPLTSRPVVCRKICICITWKATIKVMKDNKKSSQTSPRANNYLVFLYGFLTKNAHFLHHFQKLFQSRLVYTDQRYVHETPNSTIIE